MVFLQRLQLDVDGAYVVVDIREYVLAQALQLLLYVYNQWILC